MVRDQPPYPENAAIPRRQYFVYGLRLGVGEYRWQTFETPSARIVAEDVDTEEFVPRIVAPSQ